MLDILSIEDSSENKPEQLYTLADVKKSKEIVKIDSGIAEWQEKAKSLVIGDEKSNIEAIEFCSLIKKGIKVIENRRKFFVSPYNQVVTAINAVFKSKSIPLSQMEKDVKKKMVDYHQKQLEIARKAQEKIDEANRKKAEKHYAKVEASPEKVVMPPVMRPDVEKPQQTAKSETAAATMKKVNKWRLIDINKIPREYLCIDEKKLNVVVKAGVAVSGIEIYEDFIPSVR